MDRHEIIQGHIEIAYGHDHATGLFLAVVDNRLVWSENATASSTRLQRKLMQMGGGVPLT